MNLKKTTRLAMLLSISIILSIFESFIPIFSFIPGLKIGLANVIILFIIYTYSFKDALFVSILRVVIIGILKTGLFSVTFFFSLSGALLSILFMFIFKKITKLSIVGISVIGAISHSIGQIIIAILFLNNIDLIYYTPYLLVLSIPMGIIVGLISKQVLNEYENLWYNL